MSTAYAYDPIEQQHTLAGHPEHKGRLTHTMQLLDEDGILERMTALPVTPIAQKHLQRVHPSSYVAAIEKLALSGGGYLDQDTYVAPNSYHAALASAGALVNLVRAVLSGEVSNGMSLMRPPGHHALSDRGMGFCIFANVAIAAHAARAMGAQRVLIIDWDVHHGNGTEAIVYDDASIAFVSTHQYPFYPGTGAADDIGARDARGYTLNVPLPAGVGDEGYIRAFDELLIPYVHRFRPDLILVSAGYDAHWRDPLALEQLSLQGYAAMARKVVALADELCAGRLVVALEGGYDLEVLSYAVLNTLRILEDPGASVSDPFGLAAAPERNVDQLILELQALHGL